MMENQLAVVLLESGLLQSNRSKFIALDEANQVKVTEDTLSGMMKFITDKYNAIDFSEIEKSAGSIFKFKYIDLLNENLNLLSNVYRHDIEDSGAQKYIEVTNAMDGILSFLRGNDEAISRLYKAGNGVIQLMYTSLIAACIYGVGTLVNHTIRFVTTEKDTECEVLFDEIPNTIKHVHIKNIMTTYKNLDSFQQVVTYYSKNQRKGMNESISLAAIAGAIAGGALIILAISKVLILIREIIYSVYCMRVSMTDMLKVQVYLIQTNMESLGMSKGNGKIIARQKKIVDLLNKLMNKISVKSDATNQLVDREIRKDNQKINLDQRDLFNKRGDEVEDSMILL